MSTVTEHERDPLRARAKAAFTVFLGIGAFFLVFEHWAHVVPYVPWLLLAACPLMHLFMHRGHGHHGRQATGTSPDAGAHTEFSDQGEQPGKAEIATTPAAANAKPAHHHGG